jgi:pimeloyl-ACP methyl ester carboxylesterase
VIGVRDRGKLGAGLAFFTTGEGRPLVFLPGLAPHHREPHGMDRWFQDLQVRPFAHHHEVWWVQRRQGLEPGTTMARIAADYADALRRVFAGPVDVVGSSTGGSVALQLTADHPEVVRRLVLLSSACRLGPTGRARQRQIADLLRQGRTRDAGAAYLSSASSSTPARVLTATVGRLASPALLDGGSPDMLATIEAEDTFDLTARLPDIATPTLVVGGDRDTFYGAVEFQDTAAGLPHGRLLLHQGKGHLGAQSSRATVHAVLDFLAEP